VFVNVRNALQEEERDDREVVADEPTRGEAEEQPDQSGEGRHCRKRSQRRPVDSVVLRRDERVAVRTDAEVRDVAEVEQAGEADDDVQTEPEGRVEERKQPVCERSPSFIQNGRVAATAMKRNSLTGSGEASHPRAAGPKKPRFRAWRSSDSATQESTPIRV